MENNPSKSNFDLSHCLDSDPNGFERRKQHRREQPDRREIERFGYTIMTRRFVGERRKYNKDSDALVTFK